MSTTTTTTPAAPLANPLDIITEDQLAHMLSVSSFTVATWRREGSGPDFARLGKAIWYRREDVLNWIKHNVVPQPRHRAPSAA